MTLTPFLPTEVLEEQYDGETFGIRLELWRRYTTEYNDLDTRELCRILIETFETHDWLIPMTSLDDIVRSAVMSILEERGGEDLSKFLDTLAEEDEQGTATVDNEAFIRRFTEWFTPAELFGTEGP